MSAPVEATMMIRKYMIPAAALLGLLFAAYTVASSTRKIEAMPPLVDPSTSPYARTVAGAGIVEASTRNIAIGTHIPGVVSAVHAAVGDRVAAGDPLFTVDDRARRSELAARMAAVSVAERELDRLIALPRPEDVPPAEARVAEQRALVADAQRQLDTVLAVKDPRAVSQEERDRRRFALEAAQARLGEAEAQLARLKAGAWPRELAVARAELSSARAIADAARVEVERLTVRAPVDGEVLQVEVRPGEYAAAGEGAAPLMVLGRVDELHVRVDVDENDAWRVRANAPAVAHLKGNSALSAPLRFVRVEPYVIPKKSLTGASNERVDTRVLQVVYAFDPAALPAYVGQQVDVFIEAAPGAGSAAAPAEEGR